MITCLSLLCAGARPLLAIVRMGKDGFWNAYARDVSNLIFTVACTATFVTNVSLDVLSFVRFCRLTAAHRRSNNENLRLLRESVRSRTGAKSMSNRRGFLCRGPSLSTTDRKISKFWAKNVGKIRRPETLHRVFSYQVSDGFCPKEARRCGASQRRRRQWIFSGCPDNSLAEIPTFYISLSDKSSSNNHIETKTKICLLDELSRDGPSLDELP